METVIETKVKCLESTSFVVETKNINVLSGVTSVALDLIEIDKHATTCVSLFIT